MNMNSIQTENNMLAGTSHSISNYDVMILPSAHGEPLRFAPGNYVGNSRFRIMLSLFRQRYLQAQLFGHGHDCASIASELMDAVCNKCVPNGRFFQMGRDGRLCQQFGDRLFMIVMNALKSEPIDDDCSERSAKRVCRRPEECVPMHTPSSLPIKNEFVGSPNPFDIICENDEQGKLSLAKNSKHTGNNRLKIIFDMHKKTYKTSDSIGKQKIANDIVSSIIDDASGHFLVSDRSLGTYEIISREAALACVRKALDGATGGRRRKERESEVDKLARRRHKKAVLGRLENRNRSHSLIFKCAPPTAFNRCNGVATRAA